MKFCCDTAIVSSVFCPVSAMIYTTGAELFFGKGGLQFFSNPIQKATPVTVAESIKTMSVIMRYSAMVSHNIRKDAV